MWYKRSETVQLTLNQRHIGSLASHIYSCLATNLFKFSREKISLSSHREIEANDITFLVIGYFLKHSYQRTTITPSIDIFYQRKFDVYTFSIFFLMRADFAFIQTCFRSLSDFKNQVRKLKISLYRLFEVVGISVVLHSLAACKYVSCTWTLYGRLFMKVCWILELQTHAKDWNTKLSCFSVFLKTRVSRRYEIFMRSWTGKSSSFELLISYIQAYSIVVLQDAGNILTQSKRISSTNLI